MTAPFSGVAMLDKSEGETSFSALGKLKRTFNTRRVGHTGTLDPMATGLLIALVGPATRCARFFSALDKIYVAEVTFGAETDTDDRTGQVTATAPVPDMAIVGRLAAGFVGEIDQVPPAYSAVHVDGERAYRRARAGESVTVPARRVTVYELEWTPLDETTARMTVRCSSGTYIRSLARDIGRSAGSTAHLSSLRRTRVGPFNVDEVSRDSSAADGSPVSTLDISSALLRLGGFSQLPVEVRTAETMWNGGKIFGSDALPVASGRIVATLEGRPVCVGSWLDDVFTYELVFPRMDESHA